MNKGANPCENWEVRLLSIAPTGMFAHIVGSPTFYSAAQIQSLSRFASTGSFSLPYHQVNLWYGNQKSPCPVDKGFCACSSNRTRTCIYGLGNRYSIPWTMEPESCMDRGLLPAGSHASNCGDKFRLILIYCQISFWIRQKTLISRSNRP